MSTISERARAGVAEMPERERPISEQFRIVARAWVEADKAANILEESKSATLSQMMLKEGDVPVSKAEMRVKGSAEWQAYLDKMVAARADANLRKVQMEFIRMQFSEWQSSDANARRERQMGRQAT
tara:strand:- start:1028 stop:1405 length:378 start_codon:yes stop_codon:yes gene_type:complete